VCGRYALSLPPEALRTLFRTSGPPLDLVPNWNIAPSQLAAVVRGHPETGVRQLDLLRWGLVPYFTRRPKTASNPINARSETAAGSAIFRSALAQRRCLVPADAFYEWRGTSKGKRPYAIARVDGSPLAFAGIWEGWRSPGGEVLQTFAILTTEANRTLRRLHDRMPVILEQPDWPTWLGEAEEIEGDPLALLRPAEEHVLRFWPISRAVNRMRSNCAELLLRVDDPHALAPSEAPAGTNPA
jgi:putative SOS response-associated peptidase YedK